MTHPRSEDLTWDMAGILSANHIANVPLAPTYGDVKDEPGSAPTFIDLFAGAGGLSLGLMSSGWRGILAVEKNEMAFETLSHNLIDGAHGYRYEWPGWFPRKQCTVATFARKFRSQLQELRGTVTLIAGGPPCQGFSLAGRRNKSDYRNSLFRSYMEVVETIQPPFILLENVHGISVAFGKKRLSKNGKRIGRPPIPFSQKIEKTLETVGYHVYPGFIRAVDFGVPQMRPRYYMLAIRKSEVPSKSWCDPFKELQEMRGTFLRAKGLPIDRAVGVEEALSDLETIDKKNEDCVDSPGFKQGIYSPATTRYQRVMRCGTSDDLPDSHRLVNHTQVIIDRFADILRTCRRGVQLNAEDRKRYGLKKNCLVPLDPKLPSNTLTTLPDDLIHYSEPRILTVREYARLQSIPDWFKFRGKYTTGGDRRAKECPRYTQAGNAIPPFVGEAVGTLLASVHSRLPRHGERPNIPSETSEKQLAGIAS